MSDPQRPGGAISADVELPELDQRSLAALREVGRQWACHGRGGDAQLDGFADRPRAVLRVGRAEAGTVRGDTERPRRLAQAAMVAHWRRHRGPGRRRGLAINLLGAVLSGAVSLTAAITKFTAGAWIVVILIPAIVVWCRRVHRHYQHAREELTPRSDHEPVVAAAAPAAGPTVVLAEHHTERQDLPVEIDHLVVVPVAALDLAGLRALAYAASLPVPVLAVHVSPSLEEDERFRRYWRTLGAHLSLQVVVSPYRATAV